MKLKINKACDLSSISVLPPHARRTSVGQSGAESSVFGKIRTSNFRSQQSQPSLSQGFSSQPGMFSQLSQNSPDEIVTSEQRFDSQERENSIRRTSCLPLNNYTKEESQTQLVTSANFMCKRPTHEFRTGQFNEELEHRIGMMETSLNRLGMSFDSIQGDIMQVKRGTKEILSEMESLRQKLVVHDEALQSMRSGQEDIKASLQGFSKSMSEELLKNLPQDNFKEISSLISALPDKIGTCIVKLRDDLRKSLMEEMQAVTCSLKVFFQKHTAATTPTEGINDPIPVLDMQHLKNHSPAVVKMRKSVYPELDEKSIERRADEQKTSMPKVEMGRWRSSARHKQANTNGINSEKRHNKDSSVQQGVEQRVVVESDEDSDGGGFSCLLNEKVSGSGNYTMNDTKEEIERMLRKARRRKRKYCNIVILD